MATPFLSEIKMCSFNFPPKGWATCNGQQLPINQNQALFSLLGTTFGGNGQTTFALPNLQSRVPIHQGSGHTLGEAAGQEAVTLNLSQMPAHTHAMVGANDPATTNIGTGAFLAQRASAYAAPANLTALAATEITNVGGNQAHENMQPFAVLNFCIALQGVFPSQN